MEDSVANQDAPDTSESDTTEKREMRMMWIGSGVIVLIILALMGVSMLSNHDSGSTEITSQSRTAPQ
jgi:hypothetical protein